jgi:hypothetical protein
MFEQYHLPLRLVHSPLLRLVHSPLLRLVRWRLLPSMHRRDRLRSRPPTMRRLMFLLLPRFL